VTTYDLAKYSVLLIGPLAVTEKRLFS